MRAEVMEALAVRPGGRYIDATLGGGGHSRALLEASAPDGRVLGIDRDPEALERTGRRLAEFGARLVAAHGNFAEMAALASAQGFAAVDGILMDLGVSSDQLDTPARGFSFRAAGPLDMRMDPGGGPGVAEWLEEVDAPELVRVLREFGEERQARRIAAAILSARDRGELQSTLDLAAVVERATGGRKGARIHPATRTFQALRMAVNCELESLDAGLSAALSLLRPGGRLAVLTFHSLEDRAVKQFFRAHEGRMESLHQGGEEWRGVVPRVISLWRKPRVASESECAQNPRARSAKLRVIILQEST
jgi:16S rRNA (cytosine1402-N4)-methyltransferase